MPDETQNWRHHTYLHGVHIHWEHHAGDVRVTYRKGGKEKQRTWEGRKDGTALTDAIQWAKRGCIEEPVETTKPKGDKE